jgi:hypothetical protein
LRAIRGNLRSKIVFRQLLIIYILITLLVCANAVFADSLKMSDLIKNALTYDGKRVTVEGEAIGHLMQRGDFVWFNVNDNTNAVGIWATSNLAKDIKYLGRHAVIGDVVRVEGVFHLRCPGHGGDTDIHADKVIVTQRGSIRQLTHDPQKVNIIIFLTAILVCLYIIKILKRTR